MLEFLNKTAQNIASLVNRDSANSIEKNTLEEILIECDIDYEIIEKILSNLPSKISRDELKKEFEAILDSAFSAKNLSQEHSDLSSTFAKRLENATSQNPLISLIIGVNGAGKTTTIAKLANYSLVRGKTVLLGAGDTFRAAASEQLKLWGEKLGISVISTKEGSDPSALAFSTIKSGLAKGIEHIIIDTAGRLPNQTNLKAELEKILRVSKKALESHNLDSRVDSNLDSSVDSNAQYQASSQNLQTHNKCECVLILDGTQGSAALNQAKIFGESLPLDFAIVTKLDGSAKGGVIFSIAYILGLRVEFIGVGEKEEDLIAFDKNAYIKSLLDCIFPQS